MNSFPPVPSPIRDSLVPPPGRAERAKWRHWAASRGVGAGSQAAVSLSAAGKAPAESGPARGGPAARPRGCSRSRHLPGGGTWPRRAAARRADMAGLGRRALLFLCLLQSASGKDAGRGWGAAGRPSPAEPTFGPGARNREGRRPSPATTTGRSETRLTHPPLCFFERPNRRESLKFLSRRKRIQLPNASWASGHRRKRGAVENQLH